MAKLHFVSGDLFSNLEEFDAIGHGVNCKGVMGGGIAVEFREHWPDMYQAYRSLCKDEELLPGDVFIWEEEAGWSERRPPIIYNMATQFGMGQTKRGNPPARLDWLEVCFWKVLQNLRSRGGRRKFAMPLIGAGLGGLEPNKVRNVITSAMYAFVDPPDVFVFDTFVRFEKMEIERTLLVERLTWP